jgi:hypothetical protein
LGKCYIMAENPVSYYMPSLQTDSCNENVKLKSKQIAILSIKSITGASRCSPRWKKFTLYSDDWLQATKRAYSMTLPDAWTMGYGYDRWTVEVRFTTTSHHLTSCTEYSAKYLTWNRSSRRAASAMQLSALSRRFEVTVWGTYNQIGAADNMKLVCGYRYSSFGYQVSWHVFRVFSQYLQENAGRLPRPGHGIFLPNPYQLCHLSTILPSDAFLNVIRGGGRNTHSSSS